MAELIPLDYDALAGATPVEAPRGAIPETPEEDRASRERPPQPQPQPQPEQPKADYVVPPAPALPTVRFADEEKPKPKPDLIPLDYDALAPPKPDTSSWSDPRNYALVRGGFEGLQGIKGGADFLTVMDLSFGGKSDEEKKKILLEKPADQPPSGYERRVPSVTDIGGLGDLATWFQESAASGTVSTMPSLIGGIAGGIGGEALAGPVGGLVGAAGGAALPSVALGVSGMYQDMKGNEGVRKALQDGTITPDQFQKIVWIGGLMTGALDSIPAAHWGGKAIGLEMAKKEVSETLIKAAIKGGLEEGSTESLQQIVSEVGQSQGGGDTSIGQAAIHVLDAGLQGLVGGLVFGGALHGREPADVQAEPPKEKPEEHQPNQPAAAPPKPDDTHDVSAPTQPEGTPASTDDGAGRSSPGGRSAATPAPPAGSQKQPIGPATEPGQTHTVVPSGGVPDDVGAALAAQTGQPAAQPTSQPQGAPADAFDIRHAIPEDATPQQVSQALDEHDQRIAAMLDQHAARQKQQEAMAAASTPKPAGTDEAAALNAATAQQAPQAGGGVGAQVGEPMGTGQALNQKTPQLQQRLAQLGYSPEDIGAMTTGQAWAAARGPARDLATPEQAGPRVEEPATTVPPEGAAPLPPGQANLQPGPEATAAAAPEAAAAPAAAGATERPAAEPAPEVTLEPAPAENLAAFQAEPVPAAPPVGRGRQVVEEVKARKKAREAPAEAPVQEAPVARPTSERVSEPAAPAEEGPPRPAPTRLSRDAAENARTHPDLQRSAVSELPGFDRTLHDVAAEVVARHRAESPGASPAQVIRDSEREIVDRTRERMAPAEAEADKALPAETGKTTAQQIKEERQAAQSEKAKKQAGAATGQQMERAGKTKGKSATGILAEKTDKPIKRAIAENKKLPPEARDPLLEDWDRLNSQQNKLAKNPSEKNREQVEKDRANFIAQKQDIREQIAARAEAEVAARGGFTPERAAVRDQVRSVLAAHALPELSGPARAQENALVRHVRAFKAALKAAGVKLADHIDRVHQSMEENLAIFARKVSSKPDAEVTPHDFAMAQLFADNGADGDFYNLVTGDRLEGTRYSEDIGEDTSRDVSTPEDEELSHLAGPYQQAEFTAGTEEPRPRQNAGVAEVIARAKSRAARDEAMRQPPRPITVTRPSDGARVTVTAATRKGSDVLREVSRSFTGGRLRGFIGTIHNALVRHLTSMVGDIDVHFVSAADMLQLHTERGAEAAGLYYNYSADQRAAGQRPMVFLNEELVLHPAEYVHTVMHEMTHAATSLALQLDTRGTRKIVDSMMRDLKAQLAPHELKQFEYAFRNQSEFIAEVFSNHDFQELLSVLPMPKHLQDKISGVSANRAPRWWDGVVSMISNAVGMLWGQRGQSYMEHVTRLFPDLTVSQFGQREMARADVATRTGPGDLTGARDAANSEQALELNLRQLYEGAKSRAQNLGAPSKRGLREIFATSGEHIRRSFDLFGGPDNVMRTKIEQNLLQRDTKRREYRVAIPGRAGAPDVHSQDVQLAQMNFKRKNRGEWRTIEEMSHEASRFGVDPSTAIGEGGNSHIYKTGLMHAQIRTKLAELQAVFQSLSPEGQAMAKQTFQHFENAKDMTSQAIIRHGVENAQRYGAELPKGKTVDDAIRWIMDGEAAKPVEAQTDLDKAFHKALGNTAETLGNVPFLRKSKGVYVPFMRNGQYFIAATERPFGTFADQKNVPKGGVLDAVTDKEKDAPNRVMFTDKAAAEAFATSHPGQMRMQTQYFDPVTKKRVPGTEQIADPNVPGGIRQPVPVYFATVQNKRVEMSDNWSYLVGRAQQLKDEGHDVGNVGISKQELENSLNDLRPPEVSRVINNLRQTTEGTNTVSQKAVEAAINDAFLRSITSPSQLQRGMKRNNVLGEDIDLIQSTHDYNRGLAHHVANLEMAPQMAANDKAVTDYINREQRTEKIGSTATARRQAMNNEINNRILGYQGDSADGKFAHVMKVVRDVTFLRHLMSPHFTIMQLIQPYTTTLPVLSSKYGYGAASAELARAYRLGMKTTGAGFRELGRQMTNLGGTSKEALNYDQFWRNKVIANEPDRAQLQDVFDEVTRNGYGASSGIESAAIQELGMNPAEIALHRSLAVAKAMPEWAEGINRYVTATAAYRLARRAGETHEQAVKSAALMVEETQGGYGAANNPTFFQHPLLKPATMFRKYSLAYGQLYWKNVLYSVGRDPAKRKAAIKALAGLTGTLVTLAGVGGLPMVEPLRMVTNILAAAGLKQDDWDKDEADMQKWVSSLIQWAGGSKKLADVMAEANMHGWTRALNIDTSNTFGADSLIAYGQPKSMNEEGVYAWLAKSIIGAQGGTLFDTGKALVNGDIAGAIPYPKIVDNLIKAYKLKTEGTVSKVTGEQYHKPYSWYEAGVKAAGFRPAEESRPFEGGTASASKQMRDTGAERRTLMARWRNAQGSAREKVKSEINAWNNSHKNPDDKIHTPDLIKSVSSRRKYEQRLQRSMEYDQ